MSYSEHLRVGELLRGARAILSEHEAATARRGNPSQKKISKSIRSLDQIRCDLDDVLAAEHSELSDEQFFAAYYPGRRDSVPGTL